MSAIRLALSLVLIPRLFATLILLPLLLSMILVFGQLFLTKLFLGVAENRAAPNIEARLENKRTKSWSRLVLYGDAEPLPQIEVCRWVLDPKTGAEYPPSENCQPNRFDLAVHTNNPATQDISRYIELANGNVERIHVCKDCHPDLIINLRGETPRTTALSVWGIWIMSLIRNNNSDFHEHIVQLTKERDSVNQIFGETSLEVLGFQDSVQLSNRETTFALIFNVASLTIIALWLALKAHRKVLDYFARNGALLPLVASTGKGTFYGAMWLLTFIRVGAFLLAAVPVVAITFVRLTSSSSSTVLPNIDLSEFVMWLGAIGFSLGFAALIASIADLKHRHQILSFGYRYLPLAICALGGLLWAVTFLGDAHYGALLRNVITAMPLFGMAPVLVAPIFTPENISLGVHALLSVLAGTFILKMNARWFAAHLEDL